MIKWLSNFSLYSLLMLLLLLLPLLLPLLLHTNYLTASQEVLGRVYLVLNMHTVPDRLVVPKGQRMTRLLYKLLPMFHLYKEMHPKLPQISLIKDEKIDKKRLSNLINSPRCCNSPGKSPVSPPYRSSSSLTYLALKQLYKLMLDISDKGKKVSSSKA